MAQEGAVLAHKGRHHDAAGYGPDARAGLLHSVGPTELEKGEGCKPFARVVVLFPCSFGLDRMLTVRVSQRNMILYYADLDPAAAAS